MPKPSNRKAAKLRFWRVSLLRARAQYIGDVHTPDQKSAEAAAVADFKLDPEQRKRLVAGARLDMKKRAAGTRRAAQPATWPRTFEEVLAANLQDPFHAARIARLNSGESFDDPAVGDPGVREVSVHPDCEGGGYRIVEWSDAGGGCYVTTFDGPLAERRAREYFDALKAGRLKVLRET